MGLLIEIAAVGATDEADHAAHDGALDVSALAGVHLDRLAPLALRVGSPAVEGVLRGARALAEDLEDAAHPLAPVDRLQVAGDARRSGLVGRRLARHAFPARRRGLERAPPFAARVD